MTDNPLTPDELERYARHIVLPEVGGAGQQAFKSCRVLIIGAGGLGAPVALYLAAAGIGTLGIADDDTVALSNLQRQIIHDTDRVGQPKATSAAVAVNRLNPHVRVTRHDIRVNDNNIVDILVDYDIVADGSDNFATRYLVSDACAAANIPLVTAAVGRFDGSVTTLLPYRDSNPGYRDLFPTAPPEGMVAPCAEVGILGALTGVIGSIQALEVLKLAGKFGEPLIGRLLLYDGLAQRFETIHYTRASGN